MIFLDVETKSFFDELSSGPLFNTAELGVSFAGAYDSDKDEFMSFWEKDLGDLEGVLKGASKVVGYNIWAFDYGVLAPYMKTDLRTFPTVDLMVAMKRTVGFRPKLDDLARANLGAGKIGKGVDATEYWKRGELDKLEEYCIEDVRLTYEVWRVGEENGKLKYFDKSGFIKETRVLWQEGFRQILDESVQGRLL